MTVSVFEGTTQPDGTSHPWVSSAVGSTYHGKVNGQYHEWRRVRDGGTTADWESVSTGAAISPDAYGADSTGVVDSTAAINSALSAAGAINLSPAEGDKPIAVLLNGRYKIKDTIVVPHHVSLVGIGRGRGMNFLVADDTDPAGNWALKKPMVSLGEVRAGGDQNAFGCSIENIDLRGEDVAHVGVESFYANELCGCVNVSVTGVLKFGFHFVHTGGQTTYANALSGDSVPSWAESYDDTRRGYAQNYNLRDCVVALSSSMLEGAAGLFVWGGGAAIRGIDGFTASTAGSTNALEEGLTKTAGIRLENCRGVVISRYHAEKLGDGVRIGEYHICRGVTVQGVTGHESIENLVHICDVSGTNYNITVNNAFGVSTTITATGAAVVGSGVSVPVGAISVPLVIGNVLTFTGSKILTLTANAAAGATTLVGDLTGSDIESSDAATWANTTIYDEAYPDINAAASAIRIREVNVGLYILDRYSMFTTAAVEAAAGYQMFLPCDIAWADDSHGPLLIDRTTATVYRLYVDSGALAIESV